MGDIYSRKVRSSIMSKVKSKNTKPELVVRRYLFTRGFRYRLHAKELPGKPDLVLPKYRIVIFVNGCFWHSHIGCKRALLPKTNSEWWKEKIEKNVINDHRAITILNKMGWRVHVVWECELKKSQVAATLQALEACILVQ